MYVVDQSLYNQYTVCVLQYVCSTSITVQSIYSVCITVCMQSINHCTINIQCVYYSMYVIHTLYNQYTVCVLQYVCSTSITVCTFSIIITDTLPTNIVQTNNTWLSLSGLVN